jgi:hypothetical protein
MKLVIQKEGMFRMNDDLAMRLMFIKGIKEAQLTDDGEYIFREGDHWESFDYYSKDFREDEDLIALVEKGHSDELSVVEVPDGIKFILQITPDGEEVLKETVECH